MFIILNVNELVDKSHEDTFSAQFISNALPPQLFVVIE